jgi:hypothetical protein
MNVATRVIKFPCIRCGAFSQGIAVVPDFSGGTDGCQRVSEQVYLLDGNPVGERTVLVAKLNGGTPYRRLDGLACYD